jgi:hypothetical protein
MKFSFARGALALMATLTLASCGGGKATFPINVTVYNVLYPGLVLSTNGQDVAVNPPADPTQPVNIVFPKQIEYGETYDVIPKGQVVNSDGSITPGAMPKHQHCSVSTSYPTNLPTYGTAGQLAKIQIYYVCSINTYQLTGKVTGLKGTGLVLANGSSAQPVSVAPAVDAASVPTGADVALVLNPVAYNATYGVSVLTQPAGQTCTVSGGADGKGSGTMDDAAEAAGGVTNLLVTCADNPK